jgi:uncharacterized membrane protein
MSSWFHPQTFLDKIYEIGIVIKGIDGLLELGGGLLVILLSPSSINGITRFLTENALQKDPHNFIAGHIAKSGAHLASGHNFFAAAFLLTHGLVKVVLVICLFLNKLWAYPWSLVILSLFLIYQIYQLITSPTFGMAFLSVLDAIIIFLIYREWQKVREHPEKQNQTAH